MDNYKIDVTGKDIFSKGYGIVIVYNNQEVYGYKFSETLQQRIKEFGRTKKYGFTNHKLLKPKVYSAIVSAMIKKIHTENTTNPDKFTLSICNDFDGHGNTIITILRENLAGNYFTDITSDNYVFVKHPKKSIVQQSAVKIFHNDWTGINKLDLEENEIHNLIAKKSHKSKKW